MFLEAEPREMQSWAENCHGKNLQLLHKNSQHLEQQGSMGMAEPSIPLEEDFRTVLALVVTNKQILGDGAG